MVSPFVSAIIESNLINPLSKVLRKEFSSSLITLVIKFFCDFNSGKASPSSALKVSTNL